MSNLPVRRVWLAIMFCFAPAFSQSSVTYDVSFAGVPSGPVPVPAFTFRYASNAFLQPNGNLLVRLLGQPGFSFNGPPPSGYALSDAVYFPNSGAPYFSLGFVNGPSSILVDLHPVLASPLMAAGTYALTSTTNLLSAGAAPVVGNPGTGTLTIATAGPGPVLSVNPTSVNVSYRPMYSGPDPVGLSVTTNGASVDYTVAVSGGDWMAVDYTQARTPYVTRLTFLPYTLRPGVYTGKVTISAPAASNPVVTVDVTLTVEELMPFAYITQVSNTGSYAPAGAPNGGIAQGSLFAVFGLGIGPQTLVQSAYPLRTNLAGTSAQITVGSTSVDALMVYTSSGQIAAILPSRTPLGDGTLTVSYNGASSPPYPIKVVLSALGVYTVASNGLGPGIITGADFGIKSVQAPARPGETLLLWGTGLGAVDGDESVAPTPGNRFSPQVYVAGKQAKVTYAGRAGCCGGLDQINFEVPEGVSGCFVPVAVRNAGVVSNFTTLPVAGAGECSDTAGFSTELVKRAAAGGSIRTGFAVVGPLTVLNEFGFLLSESVAQRLSAVLGREVDPRDVARLMRAQGGERARLMKAVAKKYGVRTASQARKLRREFVSLASTTSEGFVAGFATMGHLAAVVPQYASMFPPSGTCTLFQSAPTTSVAGKGEVRPMDAGTQLTLSGPAGTKTLARFKAGEYQALLGTDFPPLQAPAGTYQLTGTGGADLGSFTTSMRVDNALVWTNKSATTFVDRSQPLTVTWSGGPAAGHVIFGGYAGGPERSVFLCTEDVAKGSLTVPQYVLSAMPAVTSHDGYVLLAAQPLEPRFSVPGLDVGFFFNLSNDGKAVEWR